MATNLLASDVNNPDFAGAMHPDSRLTVRFYTMPLQNDFETQKQGRPIFADLDMIEIMVPGDPLSIICQPVREDHKKRFPLHWAHYQNKHGGDSREIGTPLASWSRLTPAQCEELRALKFYTVENIAGASDASLQKLGMMAGMSPYTFRDHAVRFLAIAKDDSIVQAAEEKVKAMEADNAKFREETAAQMAEMRELLMLATAKKKPGRPKKEAP